MIYDAVIVGQGLAGTVLCHKLIKNGLKVMVIDAGLSAASKAAAGIINPVTGRNYVKSWLIEDLLPEAVSCYKELEILLDVPLIQSLNVARAIHTVKEENDWAARQADPAYSAYISPHFINNISSDIYRGSEKYGEILQGYRVDLTTLIDKYRAWLISQEKFLLHQVDYEHDIKVKDNGWHIKSIDAKTIVFAEGYRAMNNPWFPGSYLQPNKGDAMIINCEIELSYNFRDEYFITPIAPHTFWVGSNYDTKNHSEEINEANQEKMIAFLENKLQVPFTVLKKLVGVRPSTKTRKPMIASSSDHKGIYIFNGLGTKGTSLAPYFSNELTSYLLSYLKTLL
jgi:glycine oxidase